MNKKSIFKSINDLKKINQNYLLLLDYDENLLGEYLFKEFTLEEFSNILLDFENNIYYEGYLVIDLLHKEFMRQHMNYHKEDKNFVERYKLWRELRRRELIAEKRYVEFLLDNNFRVKEYSRRSETGVVNYLSELIEQCFEQDIGYGIENFSFVKQNFSVLIDNYHIPSIIISVKKSDCSITYKKISIYDKNIYKKLKKLLEEEEWTNIQEYETF